MFSVKLGAAATLSATVSVCVSDPLVPVIVSVEFPDGVLAVVVIVSVELFPAATDAGLNAAVAPAGNPLNAKLTDPLKLPTAATLTV